MLRSTPPKIAAHPNKPIVSTNCAVPHVSRIYSDAPLLPFHRRMTCEFCSVAGGAAAIQDDAVTSPSSARF